MAEYTCGIFSKEICWWLILKLFRIVALLSKFTKKLQTLACLNCNVPAGRMIIASMKKQSYILPNNDVFDCSKCFHSYSATLKARAIPLLCVINTSCILNLELTRTAISKYILLIDFFLFIYTMFPFELAS